MAIAKYKVGQTLVYENYWTKFLGKVHRILEPQNTNNDNRSVGLYASQHHYILVDVDTGDRLHNYQGIPECNLVSQEDYNIAWNNR